MRYFNKVWPAALLLALLHLAFLGCRKGKDKEGEDAAEQEAEKEAPEKKAGKEKVDLAEMLKSRVYAVALDTVEKNIVYVGSTAGIVIYDAADPSKPAELSTVHLPGSITSIVQEDRMLLASIGPDGVAVVDAEKKDDPHLVSTVKTQGAAWKALLVQEGFMAVADGSMGVSLVDVSDWSSSSVLARWRTEDYVRDIALERKGDRIYIYAACGRQGLVLLDASSLKSFAELSTVGAGADVRHLHVQGSKVFAAAGEKGFVAAEREGNRLRLLSTFDPSAEDLVRGVFVSSAGSTAFLTAGEYGIVFLDLSDTSNVKKLGVYDYFRSVNRLVVEGDRAYVAADAGGLLILDVSKIPDVKVIYQQKSP